MTADQFYQLTSAPLHHPPPTNGGNDELEPNMADLRVDQHL